MVGGTEIRAAGAPHRAGRLHRGGRGGDGAARPSGSPYRGGAGGLVTGPSGAGIASAARDGAGRGGDIGCRAWRHHPLRQSASAYGLSRLGPVRALQRRQGGITKAGNGAARRMLVEAAWSYRFPARVSREQLLRQEGLAKPIRDIAWKAQERLCRRYRKLARAGNSPAMVTTAIARELSGFRGRGEMESQRGWRASHWRTAGCLWAA